LISLAVTPGASPAREAVVHARPKTITIAQASLTPWNMEPSLIGSCAGNGAAWPRSPIQFFFRTRQSKFRLDHISGGYRRSNLGDFSSGFRGNGH
jgi:hypothetical protein